MKEAYLILAERENKPKCMDCTWFKTDPNGKRKRAGGYISKKLKPRHTGKSKED